MKFVGPYSTLLAGLILLIGVLERPASAQLFGPRNPPMKKASELIRRGGTSAKVEKSLESVINQDNSRVVVSIGKQRATVMVGDKV